MAILKQGMRGEPVRILQRELGVGDDGIFGAGTHKALQAWQTSKGLAADGIAGPDTFAAMGRYELVLLKRGTKGETVKLLQKALGQSADGAFGAGTEAAVRALQEQHGLKADGIVGPQTLAKLDLFPQVTAATVMASMQPADWIPVDGTPDTVVAQVGASVWDTVSTLFA